MGELRVKLILWKNIKYLGFVLIIFFFEIRIVWDRFLVYIDYWLYWFIISIR